MEVRIAGTRCSRWRRTCPAPGRSRHPGAPGGGGQLRRPGVAADRGPRAALGPDPRSLRSQHHRQPVRSRSGRRRAGMRGARLGGHPGRRDFVDLDGEAAHERRQYCHGQVLALIKRRTLALLRKEVEPVEQVAYARFLAEWQGVGSGSRGSDAVLAALEQLSGYPMPASAVESVILPARVADYSPAMLDELPPWRGLRGWATAGSATPTAGCAGTSGVRTPARCAPTRPTTAVRSCWRPCGPAAPTSSTRCCHHGLGRRPVRVRGSPVGPGLGRAGHRGHLLAPRALAGGGAHRRAPARPLARTHRARLAGGGLARPVGRRGRLPDDGWPLVPAWPGQISPGRAAGRRRLRPAGPLRRRQPGQRDDRERGGGLRSGLPGPERPRGDGPVSPWLLHRGSRRCPVRAHGRRRPVPGAAA